MDEPGDKVAHRVDTNASGTASHSDVIDYDVSGIAGRAVAARTIESKGNPRAASDC